MRKKKSVKGEEKTENNIKCFIFSQLSAATFVLHIY